MPTWLSTPRKDQHRKMRTALLNTCTNDFYTDQKYSILYGGLLAASELNEGQTLFQDMCDRLQRGEYGQQSELALIACKYNLEIVVFESGTQQWAQKPTGTHQQKHIIALRWCRESIHYDWLKRINSDEPKRVTPLPLSLKLGPNFTDANNSPLPTSQESNRSRQPKNKFSRCLNFRDVAKELAPYKYAGYPMVMDTLTTVPMQSLTKNTNIIIHFSQLVYLTCLCCSSNARELVRVKGVEKMGTVFIECMSTVTANTEPKHSNISISKNLMHTMAVFKKPAKKRVQKVPVASRPN